MKKEEFLSNKESKQRFLIMLSEWLEWDGCEVHHAKTDADLLIVQTAILSAARCETVLVGDDTDPQVLCKGDFIQYILQVRTKIWY